MALIGGAVDGDEEEEVTGEVGADWKEVTRRMSSSAGGEC